MTTTPSPWPTVPPTDPRRAVMAELARNIGSAIVKMSNEWYALDLPGDFSTPETGYPFPWSLEDMGAEVFGWADRIATGEDA